MSRYDLPRPPRAAALKYEDGGRAPVIVAAGQGRLAEKIIETACENGVKIYEDASLATLLTQLELGAEIPENLYRAIVDIYVYFLNYVPGSNKRETPPAGDGQ